jgi:hypothetical protein
MQVRRKGDVHVSDRVAGGHITGDDLVETVQAAVKLFESLHNHLSIHISCHKVDRMYEDRRRRGVDGGEEQREEKDLKNSD